MLRSPSAGKLLQYTVDDGGHVCVGHSYAEIEVALAFGWLGSISEDALELPSQPPHGRGQRERIGRNELSAAEWVGMSGSFLGCPLSLDAPSAHLFCLRANPALR